MLVMILHAIMIWQQGNCWIDPGHKVVPCVWSATQVGDFSAPFDVPPVEEKNPGHQMIPSKDCQDCMKFTHTTCADKARFLIPSEDGKLHCLALGQKP